MSTNPQVETIKALPDDVKARLLALSTESEQALAARAETDCDDEARRLSTLIGEIEGDMTALLNEHGIACEREVPSDVEQAWNLVHGGTRR